MKIVLLGYMASGKSAIGVVLAKKLNIQFIDLDSFIEKNEGMCISDIFKEKGEVYFRKIENYYLFELLNLKKGSIISVGGGTPCYGANMELIETNSISIYLKASIDTIYERLKNEATQRPLVAEIRQVKLKEYITKHLFERNYFYQKAKHTVSVNEKKIVEIVEEIKELL